MIRMQKKRVNLRKTKSKSALESRNLSLMSVIKSSTRFVLLYKKVLLLWCLANFVFLYVFNLIPNGWTNSLSILWLVAYYVFWSIFIRQIQQHQPYFSLIRIFNGLIPTSKIMFINISICVLLKIIPYIPFFMGFREKYLEYFENYMAIMQSNNAIVGITLFYILMLLISPFTLSRPFLAYISALIGKSRSILDAYKRTTGNYWSFVECAFMMSTPFILFSYIDTLYNTNITLYISSFLSLYFNIVFINIYKVFYKRKAKAKPSN